jgi:glycosyltransferase involved in cell wall biosynthesis
MRANPLLQLLQSVRSQTIYPDEILIVDGSTNLLTQQMIAENLFPNLRYFKVDAAHRGLTKQRNYGICNTSSSIDIVCFLDDDTVLESTYFENILHTYESYPEALGVGGYINNEDQWEFVGGNYQASIREYYYDGWKKMDGSRFVFRKRIGLDSDTKPGFVPEFSHGRSISFLPPSGKIYEVEQLMGGVSSFRKEVFEGLQFSTYFEGYGLYEDADFTFRVSKIGKLFVNTGATLAHYHDQSGRPNQYVYGKMVVRNGWYVWRVKHPFPSLKSKLKWHLITLVLAMIRGVNVITTAQRKRALTEFLGRMMGWFSLFFNKPNFK